MAHEGKRHGFAGSGNSQIYTTGSVADKLSELKANETAFLKFKPLSSMTVDAGQVSTFVQKLDVEKSNVGVNDQYYDDDVPNLSILNEEINTGNAGYTSNVGDELISKEGGIQYQEIGHTDAYKDAVEATKQKLKTARVEDKRQNDRIENIAKASDDQAYVDNSRRLAAELQKKDKINESALEREQEIKKRVNKIKKEEKAKKDSAARLKKIQDKSAEIAVENALNQAEKVAAKQQKIYDDEKAAKQAAIEANEKAAYQNQINTDIGTPDGFFAGSNDKSGYDKNTVYAKGKTDEVKKAEAFEKAKAEGKANAEKLMAEMDADNLAAERAKTEAAELAARQAAVAKREALVEELKVEDEITAFETQLAKDLKADQDSRDRLEKIKTQTAKIEAENAINQAEAVTRKKQAELDKAAEKDKFHTRSDIFEAKRLKEKLAKEKAEKDAKNQSSIDDEQSTNAKKTKTRLSAEQREKDIKQRTSALKREQEIEKRTAKLVAEEKADKERKLLNAQPIASERGVGDAEGQKSLADKLEQNRKNELLKQNSAERIGSKMDRDSRYYDRFKGGGNFGKITDPFRFSTLAYPRNVTNNMANGHYLLFYVNVQNKTGYKYEGVTPTDGDFSIGDWVEKLVNKSQREDVTEQVDTEQGFGTITRPEINVFEYEKGANKGSPDYKRRQVLAGAKGNILRHNQKVLSKGRKTITGMEAQHKTTTRITDSVAMYLPANVQNDTSVQYQGFETGLAGFLALGGKGILDKIVNQDYAGAAGKFTSMAGATLKELLKKVGVEAITAFTGGQGIQQAFDKAFGNTLNPYLEVAFESMGVRSFNYEFTFSPRNEEESQDAKDIIELFRFHMAPELKGAQHRYLTLPSTFDIHYMYQTSPENSRENDFYNKIATCVLTKVNVNYAPGGVQSFDSGAPVSTTMTLEFMETEMLTKEKIQQGF